MKKFLSITLTFILALSIFNFTACENGCGGNKEFHASFRFVVTSDIHVREDGAFQSLERLNQVFDTAYSYTDSHEEYNNLDAIIFVGDNTQNGATEEQKLFFDTVNERTRDNTYARAVMGNHEFYAWSDYPNWHYSPTAMTVGPQKFLEYSGYASTDEHTVIGGYHFIFLSMDAYGSYTPGGQRNRYFSDEKIDWLKTELDLAVADDPTGKKPIFVFQHIAPENTVYASSDKDKKLRNLLNDYPNVVDFSGHTHVNINDPRSVWQGEFTALNTGSMAYIGVPIVGHPNYSLVSQTSDSGDWKRNHESGIRNAGMYYICEMSDNNVLKVQIYDAINDCLYESPIYIDSFGNPKGFDHLPVDPEKTDVPTFESGSVIVASNNYKNVRLLFPQAECDEYVATYRIEVWNSSRKNMRKAEYRLSGYHLGVAMPSMMEVYINGLADDFEYAIDIYAISVYGKESKPLTVNLFTSLNDENAALTPDVLNVNYLGNGMAENINTNKALSSIGSPVVSDDKTSVELDGNSAFAFKDIPDWYDVISTGFSLEAFVKINQDSTTPQAIISNYNDGGFSLYYQDGNICFKNFTGIDENVISSPLEIDTWAHVVAVYSYEKIHLYVNGVLAVEQEINGAMVFSKLNSNLLLIGANSGTDRTVNQYAKCSLKTVNVYTHALGEEGIQKIYAGYLED